MSIRVVPALLPVAALAALSAGCPEPDAGLGPRSSGPDAAPSAPGGPPSDPGATQPDAARFKVSGPDAITVSGTFDYGGTRTGAYRLDFVQKPTNGPPRLVHTVEIDKPGAWEIHAPKDFGEIYVVGFIDQKGDGPSADDPSGRTSEPVQIGAEDITGVIVPITDDPELGELGPGAADGPPPPPPMMPEGQAEGPPPGDTPEGTPAAPEEETPPEAPTEPVE